MCYHVIVTIQFPLNMYLIRLIQVSLGTGKKVRTSTIISPLFYRGGRGHIKINAHKMNQHIK